MEEKEIWDNIKRRCNENNIFVFDFDKSFDIWLSEYMFDGGKVIIEVPGINQWDNDGPFSKNINPVDIKVGDRYYFDFGDFFRSEWKLIEVTYVRGDVIFCIRPEEPDNEEEHILIKSIMVQLGGMQPVEYIVDCQKHPRKYYDWDCWCPYTKIIYINE
jgi:hypothetical protein